MSGHMNGTEKSHPFWTFSLSVYAQAGVEQACLALQKAGADVNLLLFCCWLGAEGRQIDKRQLKKLMSAVSVWQEEVLSPLRRARRAVKKGIPGMPQEWGAWLRRGIAAAELDAEYVEQLILAGQAAQMNEIPPLRNQETSAAVNLQRYLELLALEAPARRHVQALLVACGCRAQAIADPEDAGPSSQVRHQHRS
jgi:uncharacterized protein (TIGR02444 family)